jgi:hypothetical protein
MHHRTLRAASRFCCSRSVMLNCRIASLIALAASGASAPQPIPINLDENVKARFALAGGGQAGRG